MSFCCCKSISLSLLLRAKKSCIREKKIVHSLTTMESSIADLLLGKIVSILENESSLLSGLRDEINKIKDELHYMKCFLEDADTKGVHGKTENNWVSDVRDMAYEVEDIIDEFLYHAKKQQRGSARYTGFFLKAIHYPGNLLLRHKVAVKLRNINQRIKSIPEMKQRYQLEGKDRKIEGMCSRYDDSNSWLKTHNESALFLRDDELLGIEKAQNKLLRWLIYEGLDEWGVISVLGMGGLGKTTLVANTFNKEIVQQRFDCVAWITVSQQYAIREQLGSLIKEVYKKANEVTPMDLLTIDYRDLVETLVKFLHTKRYLIVFDDVWSINFWHDISKALPPNMNGSRILLTTRMEDIAYFQFGFVNHVLQLMPLTVEESWKLFCMKAFASRRAECPPYLESLARNLVAKCDGLPLAIVALGGLMATKQSTEEWKYFSENLNWELSENDKFERPKFISLLGYHDLPYRLKHCFLYCCIFPEDYVIKRKRLIRLWMAEGFVEPLKVSTPEVVADRYLMDLICRGLLQVVSRNESGRPKRCKMHDILREIAVSLSEEEKFVAKSDGKEEVKDNGIRRLSIEAKDKEMKGGKGISRLRSLFVFTVEDISRSLFKRLPSGFKLLTVLDLEDAPISELPGELVKLFNLRYLNLTGTKVKELPNSLGNLYNLQFLIIANTQIKELPPGIVKLRNLRYLIAYRKNDNMLEFHFSCGTSMPFNICSLKSLQALSFLEAWGNHIKQLSRMTQLTSLCIANVKEADEKDLCFSIGKMRLLRLLALKSCNEDEQLKMDALESAPPNLEKFILVGKLEKIPHWFKSLYSLSALQLHWCRLREDFLPHIQALPNLGNIILVNAYEGERLCLVEGFQKLKILKIGKMRGLKEIVINKGVMPGLEELEIYDCQELKALPDGWDRDDHLPHLKQVYLEKVSEEIAKQIRGEAYKDDEPPVQGFHFTRAEDDKGKLKWRGRYWY